MSGDRFAHRHAHRLYDIGQNWLRDRQPILYQHLGYVEVGAELERDVKNVRAVVAALRRHVQHVLDAINLLLDRRSNRIGNDLRVRARDNSPLRGRLAV